MNCFNSTSHQNNFTETVRSRGKAFTLIELLVVITIIGILAAVGLPAIKGWGEGNAMTSATRQLMDDLSLARQRAISSRSTVFVVFVSPNVVDSASFGALTADEKKKREKLFSGQYTTYALFTKRPVGEQPGRENPRYLTPWKSLPDKTFIAVNKFEEMNELSRFTGFVETNRPFATNAFPFPTVDSPALQLPYVAFNSQGQLISEKNAAGQNESASIPVTQGSIFYARDRDGNLLLGPADAVETPRNNSVTNFNNIRIDWLTGRSRLERRDFQ